MSYLFFVVAAGTITNGRGQSERVWSFSGGAHESEQQARESGEYMYGHTRYPWKVVKVEVCEP